MFKATTEFTIDIQKELTKNFYIYNFVIMILGIIGLIAHIGISMFIENTFLEYLLWISAFLFAQGLVFIIIMKKNIKRVSMLVHTTNNYEFFEEYFTIASIKHGETIANSKVYYKELVRYRKTKNYLFLYQINNTAFPVKISELGDLNLKLLCYLIDKAKGKIVKKNS